MPMKMGKVYRVYATEPTNSGEDMLGIELFKNIAHAKKYFKELCRQMKEESADTDDYLRVILEDVKTGRRIEEDCFSAGVSQYSGE